MDGLDTQCGEAQRHSSRIAHARHCDGSRYHRQDFGWRTRGSLNYPRCEYCRRLPAVRLFVLNQTMDSLTPNQAMKRIAAGVETSFCMTKIPSAISASLSAAIRLSLSR